MIRRLVLLPLVIGLVTVAGCAGKPEREPETPTEQQSLDRSARLAFGQGNYAQAATLYEAALQSALTEDAPGAIIDARFNLALCQTYLGDYEAALQQVAQADAEEHRHAQKDEHVGQGHQHKDKQTYHFRTCGHKSANGDE